MDSFVFTGPWSSGPARSRVSGHAGDAATLKFSGNQVRVLGNVGPEGGWADAFVDGIQQPTVVECWNPTPRQNQPIFIKKGLGNGPHEVKLNRSRRKNPLATAQEISVDGANTRMPTGMPAMEKEEPNQCATVDFRLHRKGRLC